MSARRADRTRLAYYRAVFAQCSHLGDHVRHPKTGHRSVHALATAAGMSAGGGLRSRDCLIRGALSRPLAHHRAVLLDTNGGPVARVPRKAAMEMLLTGEADLREEGRTVLAGESCGSAGRARQRDPECSPASSPPKPTRTSRWASGFQHQLELGLSNAYEICRRGDGAKYAAREAIEGIGAFLDKRPPKWPLE